MFAKGNSSVTLEEILNKVSEGDLLTHYLGITKVPCILNSPLREDNKPSFGLFSFDGKRIFYTDFATKDKGGLFDLLGKMWHCTYMEVLERINKDLISKNSNTNINRSKTPNCHIRSTNNSTTALEVKIREWKDYDIEYWNSYGISIQWLKYADVYPISHKIINKDNKKYTFKADKYAYAFVERKDNKVTIKIYQPYNKNGYKWQNKHDGSVISLWTKLPPKGDKVVICSSLKDALCLMCNTNISAIALQGEGYSISNTAIRELNKRFNKKYILFDNDNPGIINGKNLASHTGFIYTELPLFKGGKDISDLFKIKGKKEFIKIITELFKN